MGYRISLYRCPKNYVDEIWDTTNEDIENDDGILDLPRYELIKYDTLANVLDTGEEVKNNPDESFESIIVSLFISPIS